MRGSWLTIGIIFVIVVLAVAFFFLFRLIMSEPTSNSTAITVEGSMVCLPHKNSGGPVTLECTTGILADDGRYFALRSTNAGTQLATIPSGSRVQVAGSLLEPPANEKYDIAGIIDVAKITQK